MSTKVIVFGPTGNIGSVAAVTAQQHGAEVYLAMRDTSKSIPGLTTDQEKSGGYERIQADLTDPESVRSAAQKSGAKHAFIYAAHGSKDHMKSTLEAMKSGGVEFVVFLSSFTINGPTKDVPAEEVIPYIHATVEISLDQVFGPENYVAVRPGGFATNCIPYGKNAKAGGDVKIYGSTFEMDCITPRDMGRVSGTILAKGVQNGEHIVYLYGPKPVSQADQAKIVGKVFGKDVNVVKQTPEEAKEHYQAAGVPMPLANYMLKRLGDDQAEQLPRPHFEQGVENVKKYTGSPAMGFEEWVRENMHLFE